MYGKEIDNRIKELKISQQDIAKYVGVSNTEIKCIRNDERKTIKKDTFLKLMECLDLDPYDFGGFAKLDLTNPNDFNIELDFLKYLKNRINEETELTARSISLEAEISEAQMSRILSGKKTEISIDCFALICGYINVDYQEFLVDNNVVPSFYKSMLEIKKLIEHTFDYEKIDELIQYSEFIFKTSDKEKRLIRNVLNGLKNKK